jgi:hypothetical protein
MKETAKLIGPPIVVIILFVLVVKLGFAKIGDLRSDIAKEQKSVTILTEKLNLLSQVDEEADQASFTSAALPPTNPSLTIISQLKTLAASSGLLISGVKAGSQSLDKAEVSKVDINFDIGGDRSAIFQFLQKINTIAPISRVDKVKLVQLGGVSRASVTVRSYFAALPEKLPAISDAITDLTPDEKQTLKDVLGLTQPTFIEVTASQNAGKADPFGP